ncbi:MAG: 30S ribosomal protein S5 [bacterium]|nr:30S ribosomal protein S5 [bacterium]
MADEIQKTEETKATAPVPQAPSAAAPAPVAHAPTRQGFGGQSFQAGGRGGGRGGRGGGGGGGRGGSGGNRRGGGGREERAKPEFDQKMLGVRRVARVVAGGRRFNFSVLMVIGNRKGSVGVGTGKAGDTALAIEKATKNAKKEMIRIERTATHSIPHVLEAKYSSAQIVIFPAPNKGLTAGSALRSVLELAGLTDVNAKIRSGSKNKLNIARATIAALKPISQKSSTIIPKPVANPVS